MKKTSPAFLKEGGAVTSREAVEKARQCLENVTPMESDCGELCAAACCCSLEGEETGMLLFPGEEALYEGCSFGRVVPAHYSLSGRPALLFVCRGTCPRQDRPLACRLFPLRIRLTRQGPELGMDPRSAGVCPLYPSGVSGLAPAFRDSAAQAARILAADPVCRRFLQELDRQLTL